MSTVRSISGAVVAAAALIAALAAAALAAPSAFAAPAPRLELLSTAKPTNFDQMHPGGEYFYETRIANVGAAPTAGAGSR
jgi:hypothetical protein